MNGCVRCNGPHETKVCRAPFVKLWPGQPIIRAKIRTAMGSVIDIETPLPQAFADELVKRLLSDGEANAE